MSQDSQTLEEFSASLDKVNSDDLKAKCVELFSAVDQKNSEIAEIIESKDHEIKNLQISLDAQTQIADILTKQILDSQKEEQEDQTEVIEQQNDSLKEKEAAHKMVKKS